MEMSSENKIQMLGVKSKLFKALGHPLRLKIVHFLSSGEKSVTQIVTFTNAKISNVSRHLSHLRESGAVVSRKKGLTVYYRLNMPFVSQLLLIVKGDLGGYSGEKFEI